jgi:hypothetical protein
MKAAMAGGKSRKKKWAKGKAPGREWGTRLGIRVTRWKILFFFWCFFFGFEDAKPKGTAFEMCRHVQELVFICFHGIRKIRSWRIF